MYSGNSDVLMYESLFEYNSIQSTYILYLSGMLPKVGGKHRKHKGWGVKPYVVRES